MVLCNGFRYCNRQFIFKKSLHKHEELHRYNKKVSLIQGASLVLFFFFRTHKPSILIRNTGKSRSQPFNYGSVNPKLVLSLDRTCPEVSSCDNLDVPQHVPDVHYLLGTAKEHIKNCIFRTPLSTTKYGRCFVRNHVIVQHYCH